MASFVPVLCFILIFSILPTFTAKSRMDILSPDEFLCDGESLVSPTEIFELGFFSPEGSSNRYVGIWYKNLTPLRALWVANRDKPVSPHYGMLRVSDHGDIIILNGAHTVWIANPKRRATRPVLQLLDTGNLVLKYQNGTEPEGVSWESFDYPTNTLLPGMKLGWDLETGFNRRLTAWTSNSDPSSGAYILSLEAPQTPQLVLRHDMEIAYRWGPWDRDSFSGSREGLNANPVFRPMFVINNQEVYYSFSVPNKSIHLMLLINIYGQIDYLTWSPHSREWITMLALPRDSCDNYQVCGPYGSCYTDDPSCRCLKGFSPKSPTDWEVLDWSAGCTRDWPLKCEEGEGFLKYEAVKLPDKAVAPKNAILSAKECEATCLKDCSCVAYAMLAIHSNSSECVLWFGDLVDMRHYPSGGQDIYIRVAPQVLDAIADKKRKKQTKKMIITTICGTVLLCGAGWCMVREIKKRIRGQNVNGSVLDPIEEGPEEEELELPTFDMATISAATNNFSDTNKIGHGGFGVVYKGVLPNGEEIAVKRLIRQPGRETPEFHNEVLLFSNLQHRNLARLLGCSVREDERILIYEYMPNKSLNNFLFDQTRKKLLRWRQRFNIIIGITRGLLYLHQDSRLRIIHRDLKASNILLDSYMNPKISDFGLARIFEGDQTEQMTGRVMGTLGYISPEYATRGQFSTKSDVYSFGVLVLEIISGQRNWNFTHPDHGLNLIGHAWKLWNDGNPLELLDEYMEGSFCSNQVVRCIQVGLLCVQLHAEDRPPMSSVLFMLDMDFSVVPQPKEPGFSCQDDYLSVRRPSSLRNFHSFNDITCTTLEGR